MAFDSIPSRLLAQAKKQPNRPAYNVRGEAGAWTPTTWAGYRDEVLTAARALIDLGVKAGDKVCILGFNQPEWVVFDVAAMMIGAVPAGIYTTCSPTEVQYIIDHAEATIVLLEDEGQWAKVNAERSNLPSLKHVVMMAAAPSINDDMVMSWDEFNAHADAVKPETVQERLDAIEADTLATFIYTSGTTGPPKAVMLTHENLAWTADAARDMTGLNGDDTNLSYLPLSHIAEQMFTVHAPITVGSTVFFATSIEDVPQNLQEVQPTVVFAVPRVWEKFHAKVSAALSESAGVKAKIAGFAQRTGRAVNALRMRGTEPSGLLSLKYKIANKLVFSKLKPKLGLGRARICVSGAAPISAEILEFFAGLDVVIYEVYGQSEDTGPTTFNVPGNARFGSVGPAVPGVEVKIADDGEICVRGKNVFAGYYKDQAATDATLIDGWLHSGDLGAFDAEGFLSITGRKKEIIITAGGKNIAPKNIEAALKDLPLVSQAVIIGDRRKFLSALITLDPEAADKFAGGGKDLSNNPSVLAEIQKGIDERVNPQFARVEHVRKFTLLPRDFSVEDGELTPTMKIKRKIVNEHFSSEIEAMYQ